MMNWLRKLVGLGGTAKNLTSLSEEECKEEIQAFVKKSNLNLFQGNVQNLYSTQRIKETSVCPRCESETEKKAAVFVCATDTLPQIIISTANHFCTNCSSVIIDDKLLQKSCEKGKVYRGIIGFYIKENIQTYQSLNEYIIRYHYDQNSNPNGIKITGDKIDTYDPKIHGLKGTKSQHKIPSSPVTLMDRVERRDKRESLTDSKFSNRKDRSYQEDDSESMTEEQKDKAARSERARIAMENAGKKGRNKNTKPKKKEDFADSVKETKQDFKDKVEQKNNFNPKKRQKPVVENPNEKQDAKQEKQKEQLEAKQEENKTLPTNKKQDPPARASQRKKQTSNSDKREEENVTNQQADKIDKTDKKQNVGEANQPSKVETSANTSVEATEENAAPKKNRRYKQRRSTRKTRSNKRPVRNTVETDQETLQNEVKTESKTEQKGEQNKKQHPKPKRENIQKQKEVAQQGQEKAQNSNQAQSKANNKETDKAETNKDNKQHQNKETNNEQPKKESVIEKLHQNLQESSKASVAPKEEKQKEQQKESSRLARLKDETQEEKVSRRRPRTNVRPPIELDLKNVNPRRRYNNTKKK